MLKCTQLLQSGPGRIWLEHKSPENSGQGVLKFPEMLALNAHLRQLELGKLLGDGFADV